MRIGFPLPAALQAGPGRRQADPATEKRTPAAPRLEDVVCEFQNRAHKRKEAARGISFFFETKWMPLPRAATGNRCSYAPYVGERNGPRSEDTPPPLTIPNKHVHTHTRARKYSHTDRCYTHAASRSYQILSATQQFIPLHKKRERGGPAHAGKHWKNSSHDKSEWQTGNRVLDSRFAISA